MTGVNPADHLGLVGAVLSKWTVGWQECDKEDAFQYLAVTLVKCARNYNPETGYEFSTYAMASMEFQFRSFKKREWRMKEPPGANLYLFGDMRNFGGDANRGVPEDCMNCLAEEDRSFSRIDAADEAEALTANLKERLNVVLTRRMAGETLEEIGDDIGITRERVRQLEAKALRQILDRLKRGG